MNKLITVNLSFYNQSDYILLKHIEYWNSYPKEIKDKFTFFIIDDCSKKPASEIVKEKYDLDLHIYRVEKDLCCNIAGVRNLGATECKTLWLIILDMDTLIPKEMAKSLIDLANQNINSNICFKFNRKVPNNDKHKKHNKPHPAVCLIRKEDYWEVGGCEEDLVGHYGYTDPSFWHRARGKIKAEIKHRISLHYYPEGEADINRDKNHNFKLFKNKKKKNNWSMDFIRFKWKKVL